MELPRGGDMRSAHAGACFVRVGPRRVGSILGSILESFWEPSSPLYSLWVALVAKTGSQKRGSKKEPKETPPKVTQRNPRYPGRATPAHPLSRVSAKALESLLKLCVESLLKLCVESLLKLWLGTLYSFCARTPDRRIYTYFFFDCH